jgi:carboxymethylenebutenolidase
MSGGMSLPLLARRSFLASALACVALAGASAATRPAEHVRARDVTIRTQDGEAQAALFEPRARGRHPGLILWHDLGGLQPLYRDIGRALAARGFVVLVPNAFYRSVPPAAANVDINDAETRKTLMTYRAAATDEGIDRDAAAYVRFLDALPTVLPGSIGTVGFDVGGSYAIRAAAALPDRIGAVASIYGLGIATARPNSPHLLIGRSKAAYLIAISRDDNAREPQDTLDLRKAIGEAGLSGTVTVYEGNHGWAVPSGKAHDPALAAKTLDETVRLFKSSLPRKQAARR